MQKLNMRWFSKCNVAQENFPDRSKSVHKISKIWKYGSNDQNHLNKESKAYKSALLERNLEHNCREYRNIHWPGIWKKQFSIYWEIWSPLTPIYNISPCWGWGCSKICWGIESHYSCNVNCSCGVVAGNWFHTIKRLSRKS